MTSDKILISFKRLSTSGSNKVTNFDILSNGLNIKINNKNDDLCSDFSSLKSRVYEKNQVELKFNVNMFLKCKKSFNSTEFETFCKDNQISKLSLFNIINDDLHFGTLANASPLYEKDWIKIIRDEYIINSSWNETNRSCVFPNFVELILLTDYASSKDSPQNYILGANVKTYNTTIMDKLTEQNDVQFKFSVNYLNINHQNIFDSVRNNPSIFPSLPNDIANPFSSSFD